jgi:hypothetical protein
LPGLIEYQPRGAEPRGFVFRQALGWTEKADRDRNASMGVWGAAVLRSYMSLICDRRFHLTLR